MICKLKIVIHIVTVCILIEKFCDLLIGKPFNISGNTDVSVTAVKSFCFSAYRRIAIHEDEK